MAKTRAQMNRHIRQEALREQLANQKLVEKVIDIAKKLYKPDEELSPTDVTRLKAAADINLKLVDKYLPSLQSTTVDQTIEHIHSAQELTDDQLADIIARGSTGTATKASSQNKVH